MISAKMTDYCPISFLSLFPLVKTVILFEHEPVASRNRFNFSPLYFVINPIIQYKSGSPTGIAKNAQLPKNLLTAISTPDIKSKNQILFLEY